MGYTHYWTQTRDFTPEQWKGICDDIETILDRVQSVNGTKLANGMGDKETEPQFGKDEIAFNGVGDDSHETFGIERAIAEPRYEGDNSRWNFCKTAYKPYDIAVTACLAYLAACHGFEVSSDGERGDWVAGVQLAKTALPSFAKAIGVPKDVVGEPAIQACDDY